MFHNPIYSFVLLTICLFILSSAFYVDPAKHASQGHGEEQFAQWLLDSQIDQQARRLNLYHLRPSRNSWFRVSTYQHMKTPNGGESEERSSGDNLLRWGWSEPWLSGYFTVDTPSHIYTDSASSFSPRFLLIKILLTRASLTTCQPKQTGDEETLFHCYCHLYQTSNSFFNWQNTSSINEKKTYIKDSPHCSSTVIPGQIRMKSASIITLLLILTLLELVIDGSPTDRYRAKLIHSAIDDEDSDAEFDIKHESLRGATENSLRRSPPPCDYRLLFRPWPSISTVCAFGESISRMNP